MSRPTKLTAAVQKQICDALRNGNTREASVSSGSISYPTFLAWLKRGEEGEPLYVEFLQAVKKAEAECEVHYIGVIKKAASKQWQAAAWWLERRKPDNYGRQQKIEHSGNLPVKIVYEDA